MTTTKNKRIFILNETEINNIYALPQFTDIERLNYFALSQAESSTVKDLSHTHSKLHFILQLGYFKAKQRLFHLEFKNIAVDVTYVMQRYFQHANLPISAPSRRIQSNNNKQVLALMKYSVSNEETIKILSDKAQHLSRALSKPLIILRELLIYLEQKRVVTPEYYVLQQIIGKAIAAEVKRLHRIIVEDVPDVVVSLLDKLLSVNDISYEITALKQDPKNFNFKQIQQEIDKHKTYFPLYEFTKIFLPSLNVSAQNIEYYASLVAHHDRSELLALKKQTIYLYLLCYINYRFQRMNDHLMQSFMHYVDFYSEEAKACAEKQAATIYAEMAQDLKSAGKLLGMYADESLSELPYREVQNQAMAILPKEKIISVSSYMEHQCVDKETYTWEYHAKNFMCIIKNLRPVFMVLNFSAHENDMQLLAGANFLRVANMEGKSISEYKIDEVPIQFIPKRLRQYIYGTKIINSKKSGHKEVKCINQYKYEFMVYAQLSKHIDSNTVFYNDTLQYKSFEADIGIVKNWKQDKTKILKTLDCQMLSNSIEETLNTFENTLESLIVSVNTRINQEENKHIKLKDQNGKITWTLPYKKKDKDFDNPFYDQMPHINIADLPDMVGKHCDFMKAFTHIKPYGSTHKVNYNCIKGCVVANATGLGICKMADNSNLTYNSLASTQKNYIRLETLRNASNKIIYKISNLPIFNYHNLALDKRHASMDGQKYQTKRETFRSRYSTKYFGLDKGVVSLTMVLNHVPVNTKIIGANEYEGHYLFDLLFNNNSGLDPNRISTDTHGSNNLNFLLLACRNIEFAPCYKSIVRKFKNLCGFKSPSEYDDTYIIKPMRKINKKLIIEEWPNIQPIIAALLMKETSQSVVIKKLCSIDCKNRTKEAICEFNDILMSIYLLQYVDDVELRQFVRAALNRGEAYHQLHAVISATRGKKFRGASDFEIELWNESARLIANMMLFYNGYILSKLMLKKEKDGDHISAEFIRRLSLAGSQHFNFSGRFEFGSESKIINIDEIIEHLNKILVKTQVAP